MLLFLYFRHVLAVGTESGRILLYSWRPTDANQSETDPQWLLLHSVDQAYLLSIL